MNGLMSAALALVMMVAVQDKSEWFGLGINAYQKGNYGEAAVNFSKAIELDSMNHIFYFNRATCWIKLREYDRAIGDLQRTIELDPSAANAHMQLAVAFAELRMPQQAIPSVSRAIALDSTLPKAHYLRGRLHLSVGDTTSACEDLRTASAYGDAAARQLVGSICDSR